MRRAPEGTNKYPETEAKLEFWQEELKRLPETTLLRTARSRREFRKACKKW